MKCRKVIKNKDHYDIVCFGSLGLQNPYAVIFKENEKDNIPEIELQENIYTNKINKNGVQIGHAIIKNIDIKNKKLTYNFNDELLKRKTWNGASKFNGFYIWNDGDNTYYSYNTIQKVLNKETSTWENKVWNGLNSIYKSYIWSDNNNIYYSDNDEQYVLDRETDTWIPKQWRGMSSFRGNFIWTDGANIYYSNGENDQKVLNKLTSTWEDKTWEGVQKPMKNYIWTDGTNVYYSYRNTQYKLNNGVWEDISSVWQGVNTFYGNYIWTDGENIYYSHSSEQYILDKATYTWSPKEWNMFPITYGHNYFYIEKNYIWNEGENTYYSYYDDYNPLNIISYQFELNKNTGNWDYKTWSGFIDITGNYIWTYKNNIYYSYYDMPSSGKFVDDQYILDKATSTWIHKTWEGMDHFNAIYIWYDGEDIYYSGGGSGTQYVLDRETDTWLPKTWNGLDRSYSNFFGNRIWTDGVNIYYCYQNNSGSSATIKRYILDRETDTWLPKTWNGIENIPLFDARYIWTDGDNIYYSYYDYTNKIPYQYVLDKETDTWLPKTWNGGLGGIFTPTYMWSDGENIYYSQGASKQYVLDKQTSTWLVKKWDGDISPNGQYMWNDGKNIYYSLRSSQYVFGTFDNQSLEICYYNKKMFEKNTTNIITSLYLEMPEGKSSDQEISFDILPMAKRWNDGTTSYAENQEGLASSLIQRLNVIKGELWYKINYGLPLFEKIKDKFIMDSVIVDIVLSHPDVTSIKILDSSIENNTYCIKNLVVISKFNEEINLY